MTATNNSEPNISPAENSSPAPITPGAPRGNTNAMKHGGRARQPRGKEPDRNGLIIGKFGEKHTWALRRVQLFRRKLEARCRKVHGSIDFEQMEIINRAALHEMTIRICQKWIEEHSKKNLGPLGSTPTELLNFLKTLERSAKLRHECIRKLRLKSAGGESAEKSEDVDPWAAARKKQGE
jgi:hypothetical protein